MRSVFVHGELGPADIQSLLASVDAQPSAQTAYQFGPVRVTLVVGRKYFFRTDDHLGLVILATSNGTAQRIDISAAGGGKAGLLTGISSASDKIETDAYAALTQLLADKGLSSQDTTGTGNLP